MVRPDQAGPLTCPPGQTLAECGWLRLGPDPAILAWARAAAPVARAAIAADPAPWRCGGTWFVGVDALPNGPDGSIAGVAFPWGALPLQPVPLHPAQLSTLRPGYPLPSPEESPAAFRFRSLRDAAHLDGLLPFGPDRRRRIAEPHGWILGLPLGEVTKGPLVVWDGSHRIMARALRAALAAHAPQDWHKVDVTEAYTAARAEVFACCRRLELPVVAGEATLLHRHLIHGVAPWPAEDMGPAEETGPAEDAGPGPGGGTAGGGTAGDGTAGGGTARNSTAHGRETPLRIIAYFRPMLPRVEDWMAAD